MSGLPSPKSELYADARSFLTSRLNGALDFSTFSEEVVRGCIESSYPGGWQAFQADYMQSLQAVQRQIVSEALSPIKLKARIEYFLGRKLRIHDEIVSHDFSDTEVKFTVSRAEVDYRARRDVVKSRTLELYVFTRPDTASKWTRQFIDMEVPVSTEHVRWGAVNTPERDEDKKDQYENCFRPGTEKAPLKGWIARAELSHAQAHANETFQRTSK